ncbi:MAG: efflux RND transporter permease subunit [Bacteroidota bacterium]|nr:efflux RND transporter permease subunit [Bacteroidota bacterium]
MRSVIKFFVQHHIVGDLLMIGLLVAGMVGMTNMKSNFFPVVKSKYINIQVVYPGASPEEIETGVVAKIEENLQGIADIDLVTSTSTENAASIKINVKNFNKTDEVLQNVKNAVDKIPSFPVGMEPPIIFKKEFEDGMDNTALILALTGVEDLRELKRAARIIESDLRQLEGVSQVSLSGFPEEEIEIAIREDKLSEMGLTLDKIASVVRASNMEATGGKILTPNEEFIIRGRYKEYTAAELRDIIVVADPDGRIIRLGDIANVQEKWVETDPSRNWFNGKQAVAITINNLPSESILDVVEKVYAYMDAFNEKGSNLKMDVVVDMSIVLNQRIDLLVNNGVIGFILVLIFLALFLNVRLAFWVALAIPVSFAGMFIFAGMIGVTINVISLFGMILVIGILVDDGIVIAENIYGKYENGSSRLEATIDGTLEVLPAVFSAIITTVIAFSSFYFIEGTLGDFFRDMATVIILTLVFSLVEGAFILPAHVGNSGALKKEVDPNILEIKMTNFLNGIRDRFYKPALKYAIKQPWVSFCVIVAIFLITVPGLIGGGFVRTTFFPFIEGDVIAVNLAMQAGTKAEITKAQIDRIEEVVWEVNEEFTAQRDDTLQTIVAIDKSVGPASHIAVLNIQLLDGENRLLQSTEISSRIREKVGVVYGADNITFGAFSPFGRPISVSLLGNDIETMRLATEELKTELSLREDVMDVTDSNQEGVKEISIKLKPRAYQLGFTKGELISQIRQAFYGVEVQRLQRGRDEVRVWVRLDERDRASMGSIENFKLRTMQGLEIPFTEICEIEIERGLTAIKRIYGKRQVEVSADLSGPQASATDIDQAIKTEILPPILAKYPSISASFEGQNREVAKSQNSIAKVMPLIFSLMFLVIVLTFRSPLQATAVFGLFPFGLVGISIGHWLLDAQISLFSVLGMIALIGILVNDALVFVAAYNAYLKNGFSVDESIWRAGMNRFRPIILTSVTTVAGLAPLMLNKSFQAQFLIPMAISVAFGLLFVTVIILILLPIYLKFISPLHRSWIFISKGVWLDDYGAEPAVREIRTISKMREEMENSKEGSIAKKTIAVIAVLIFSSATVLAQTQDLSLENAIGKALQNNYGIKVAKLNSDIAHLNDHWANTGAMPQIGIGVDASQSTIDMSEDFTVVEQMRTNFNSKGINTGLNINWTLFDGMGMFAAKHSLELLAAQSNNQVEIIIEQTVEAVDFAYHNALVQIELLEVLEESMALSKTRLQEIIWSEKYGVAGTFDKLQFENAIITDSTAYLMQEVAVNTSIRNLNRLMGEDEGIKWNLVTKLATPPGIENLASLQDRVISDNSIVINANLTKDISIENVNMAKSKLYPVISLRDSRMESDNLFSTDMGSLQSGNSTNAVTLTLNFNLFNGGATKRAISQAKINREIAELAIVDQISEARKLVADAYDRFNVNAAVYQLSAKASENARIALEISESGYKDGVVGSLDYRALEVALQSARVKELQALQAWRASFVEVQRLVGSLRAPIN